MKPKAEFDPLLDELSISQIKEVATTLIRQRREETKSIALSVATLLESQLRFLKLDNEAVQLSVIIKKLLLRRA